VSSYWVNFAKTGNPNGSALPDWPAFKVGDKSIMQLAGEMKPIPLAAPKRQQFWMDYLKQLLGF
jgi:para-nitrobenzyl esterase